MIIECPYFVCVDHFRVFLCDLKASLIEPSSNRTGQSMLQDIQVKPKIIAL